MTFPIVIKQIIYHLTKLEKLNLRNLTKKIREIFENFL